ncbi:hypothetical protein Ciccas_007012 [Cichlidogyrus casuarinus]|uniref:Ig-like domain-containing protein n=1 Tax=Cichlidogyrus casuarinus TaxID=1844966 RepID=A0ABD2Q430_9PLAT
MLALRLNVFCLCFTGFSLAHISFLDLNSESIVQFEGPSLHLARYGTVKAMDCFQSNLMAVRVANQVAKYEEKMQLLWFHRKWDNPIDPMGGAGKNYHSNGNVYAIFNADNYTQKLGRELPGFTLNIGDVTFSDSGPYACVLTPIDDGIYPSNRSLLLSVHSLRVETHHDSPSYEYFKLREGDKEISSCTTKQHSNEFELHAMLQEMTVNGDCLDKDLFTGISGKLACRAKGTKIDNLIKACEPHQADCDIGKEENRLLTNVSTTAWKHLNEQEKRARIIHSYWNTALKDINIRVADLASNVFWPQRWWYLKPSNILLDRGSDYIVSFWLHGPLYQEGQKVYGRIYLYEQRIFQQSLTSSVSYWYHHIDGLRSLFFASIWLACAFLLTTLISSRISAVVMRRRLVTHSPTVKTDAEGNKYNDFLANYWMDYITKFVNGIISDKDRLKNKDE